MYMNGWSLHRWFVTAKEVVEQEHTHHSYHISQMDSTKPIF